MTPTSQSYAESMAMPPRHARPPRQLGFIGWVALSTASAAATLPLWRFVHRSGSVVLITATWGAFLTLAVVSCVRFTRRENRRREAATAPERAGLHG